MIGLPSLVWCTVTARRPFGALLGSLGGAILGAALVLSRSRAAWLAVAACVVVLFIPMIAFMKYWRESQIGGRFARLTLAAAIGGMAAIALPNTLNWNSDSPYLDSARGMVDYKSGSDAGAWRNTRTRCGWPSPIRCSELARVTGRWSTFASHLPMIARLPMTA